MSGLSELTLAICAEHWAPAATRCARCPIPLRSRRLGRQRSTPTNKGSCATKMLAPSSFMRYINSNGRRSADNQEREMSKIEALMAEAGAAGDFLQAALCQLAVNGEADERTVVLLDAEQRERLAGYSRAEARAECERVIAEA